MLPDPTAEDQSGGGTATHQQLAHQISLLRDTLEPMIYNWHKRMNFNKHKSRVRKLQSNLAYKRQGQTHLQGNSSSRKLRTFHVSHFMCAFGDLVTQADVVIIQSFRTPHHHRLKFILHLDALETFDMLQDQ
jgi:hypothetical protein